MRKILIKILLKIIGENPFDIASVDTKIMQDWLYDSFKNDGYKQYYTLRKKYIQNELSIGMKKEDYWKRVGRIDELRALNDNIINESNRRKRINNQHN